VFGIYVLVLVLHGYIFGKNSTPYEADTVSSFV
jgi:hypothetical protein